MITDQERKLIFDAAKRRGATFKTNADVKELDVAIDRALARVLALCAPQLEPEPAAPSPPAGNFWQQQIDLELLCMAFPAGRHEDLVQWIEPTRAACVRWGIDTPREIASFLANINIESAGLTRLTESLNYSTDALVTKFGRHRISVQQAQQYGRNSWHPANQEALANILYGGEWGRKNLGNTEPGDGWRFRGWGPKQLTGRDNHAKCAEALEIPLDDFPAYLRTPEGGMMAAGWFWHSHGLDAKAATPGVEDDRRAINGGTFGLAEVEIIFDILIEELLRRERERGA